MPPRADLTGKQFGRLRVLALARVIPGACTEWRCQCECGNKINVRIGNLTSGNTKSCGCMQTEAKRQVGLANKTHGEGYGTTPEYRAWHSMKARCLTETCAQYVDYGGRGITICERWLQYENFLADIGRKPSPRHSLDRIDNDGPYDKRNCRWATPQQQNINRRSVNATFITRRKPNGHYGRSRSTKATDRRSA